MEAIPSPFPLLVLVDYENLSRSLRDDYAAMADRLLSSMDKQVLRAANRVDFRLYGGWTQHGKLTPRAQRLGSELRQNFPRYLHLTASGPLKIHAELALNLLCAPETPLPDTFSTKKEDLYGMQSIPREDWPCDRIECSLEPLRTFLGKSRCPGPECEVKLANVLRRDGQKMVDSMLVADLITQAFGAPRSIVVVTSDVDVWPGIAASCAYGAHVIHIPARRESARQSSRDIPGRWHYQFHPITT